jgi:hypothetical protein
LSLATRDFSGDPANLQHARGTAQKKLWYGAATLKLLFFFSSRGHVVRACQNDKTADPKLVLCTGGRRQAKV